MGFQTPKYDLITLIRDAQAGKIQLPDFQRGYVWDDERVRQLLVTVAVGHPMGVLLLLETGSRSVHFESKPIESTEPAQGTEPGLLVLDGQAAPHLPHPGPQRQRHRQDEGRRGSPVLRQDRRRTRSSGTPRRRHRLVARYRSTAHQL